MALAGRKPARRKGRGAQAKRRFDWLRGPLFVLRHAVLWLMFGVVAYWLWLDHEVARTFETRRWALPARVYARPLELYPGAAISRQRLLDELGYLGYQRTGMPRARGQFAASQSRIEFISRGFEFWDLPEASRHVRVSFAGDKLAQIVSNDTATPIDLMRLEPAEIGRINPRQFEDRRLLSYAELPPQFIAALVAVEDRRLFEHHGFDVMGFGRAMLSNLRAMRFVQGGSTLTQQMVKNFYLTRERTLARKLTEVMMALSLEWRYEKKQILETYVNEVFLGQDGNRAVHGFGLAALFYFGKPLDELDLPALATLIGMVKGPSVYDPRRHPRAATKRRNVVLEVLHKHDLVTAVELAKWRVKTVKIRAPGIGLAQANPAFMALVKRQLLLEYSADDLKSAGLNIYTTLDIASQSRAESATHNAVAALEKSGKTRNLQVAAIIVEPASGEVFSVIGGRNPEYDGFNRALDARRSVGSVIKPLVYSLALSRPQEYSLATMLKDQAVRWTDSQGEIWEPRNFDRREHGDLTMLEALTRSLNLASVGLGMQLGLEAVRDHLRHLGVGRDLPAYPSLLLGAVEMSAFELAETYTALANEGFQVPLRAIIDVTDQNQQKLSRFSLKIRKVMTPQTAALVRFAMTRVVQRGTARGLNDGFAAVMPLAGKTGTSNDHRDSWFVGFGANRLAVTWVGRDDNQDTGLTGSRAALPLWSGIMQRQGLMPLSTELPAKLAWRYVDLRRGVVIPSSCNNGENIPVHEDSALVTMANCVGEDIPASTPPVSRRGFFERFRGLFE